MDFQREQLLKEVLQDEEVKDLVKENNISKEILENEILTLYSYHLNKKKCDGCKSLDGCPQDIIGSTPKLMFNGDFYTEFVPCKYFKEKMLFNEHKANLITLCCNLENVDIKTLFKKAARNEVYNKMMDIYDHAMKGESVKGLYLHGPYGCGKSYIMACFANKFADSGKHVVFAYFPDLVRQVKSSIATGRLEEIIDQLKSCEVLFLDDFGGETTTTFIRDEVLGAVLQERMEKHALTFITSNLDYKTLHSHLSETKEEVDELKASRIEERIKTLMEFVELKDLNYRQ